MIRCAMSPTEIAACAAQALREELVTYPKPGLVSLVDNGSHPDMDADCFLTSIEAIAPSFAEMAEAAEGGCALEELQRIGLEAERAMWEATGGRNTHRGAIFCLGLLAAAAGRMHLEDGLSLTEIVEVRWGGDIPQADGLSGSSDGLLMCREYGLGGVRREVTRGFPTVRRHGMQAFRGALEHGREAARVQAFFALLEHCEDTTLLKRGGMEGMQWARGQAREFLEAGGVKQPQWREGAEGVHFEFVRRNLTAGGAADLLAATLFINDVEQFS